eukprot:UN25858
MDSKQIDSANSTTTFYSRISVLNEDGTISNPSISELGSIKLLDDKLQAEITRALRTKLDARRPKARADNRANIEIETGSKKGENLHVCYIETSKEWKCTYRMELGKEEGIVMVDTKKSTEEETNSKDDPIVTLP